MPHCTTNFAWYLGKFIIGFTGMVFVYVGLLKEKQAFSTCGPNKIKTMNNDVRNNSVLSDSEKNCACNARIRELPRQKNKKMQNKRYSCGCNKPIRLMQDNNPATANCK